MKIIYSWGHNKEMKPLIEAEIRKWIKAGYDITSINHRDELDIERAWSPQELNKLYSNKDKNLYTLYDKIRDLAKTHDVFIVNHENLNHPRNPPGNNKDVACDKRMRETRIGILHPAYRSALLL